MTTNVVVVLFGVVAIGVLVKSYFAPTVVKTSVAYTEKGNLLVWTSNRDASGRQVVDVYDKHLKKTGTDLKFINPGRSNLIFLNQKVYVPDYGFGSAAGDYAGSPLEIPAAPFALKVFDALL